MEVAITAAEINKLRQQTGAGMMDCRKALTESNGDFEAAIDWLRKKGQKVAANRSDREAKEGAVVAVANADSNYGIIILLSAETDFVSKNKEFIDFANSIAQLALHNMPSDITALKALPLDGATAGEKLMEVVAKIGERIDITRYEQVQGSSVVAYIHGNYRIGVLVAMNHAVTEEVRSAGRDVCMQIAAMNPLAIDADKVSEEIIAREKAIAVEQIMAEGKPSDMADRIAQGKMGKFFKDNTLLPQPFVKDNNKTVGDYLSGVKKGLTITQFVRVALG